MIDHSMCRTILVVPCYNEASRLDAQAYRSFLRENPYIGLLFVNDGSTDATKASLESLQLGFEERTGIIDCPQNRGKAEAVRLGLLDVVTRGAANYVGFWDADLATPLPTLHQFVQILDERPDIDCIFGSRVKLLGRRIERSSARHYLGRLFATVVSTMLSVPVYDTHCGAKLFRIRPELTAVLNEPFLSRWVFDVEILARMKRISVNRGVAIENLIVEYPLEEWCDVRGSKVKPTDFFKALKDVVRIYLQYRKYLSTSQIMQTHVTK